MTGLATFLVVLGLSTDCLSQSTFTYSLGQAYVPENWPKEILADVGDLQIRFESRSFWTLYRIDYQGKRLCKDYFGSHYGTVVSFPGVGFIGTGHTENANEEVLALALEVDDKPVEKPDGSYKCERICLKKQSKIRDLRFKHTITIADNRIVEDVVMTADQPTKVDRIYHFMHPWVETCTEFLAELPDGTKVEGTFVGDGKMKVDKPTKCSAIFDPTTSMGGVTCVLAVPEGRDWRTWYWDRPPSYRKHYMNTFQNDTVPAGEEFHYRIITAPFAAKQEEWKKEAEKVANRCQEESGAHENHAQ